MQNAPASTPATWRARIALSALLIGALMALAGCGLIPTIPHTPATTTPSAHASYVYEDAAAGFAITFPGKPSVNPIQGSDTGAKRATYSTTVPETAPNGIYYTAGGTKASESEVDVEDTFQFLIASGQVILTDPAVTPKAIQLGGLPGYSADITVSDGKHATLIMAGEGHTLYQLEVIGGTPKQRQAFFDSFELRG